MPKRSKSSEVKNNVANSKKRSCGDGALEELWSRIEAEAERVAAKLEPRPLDVPPGLHAPWLEEAKDALTMVEHPTKGQGFIAARDLPAGTTLVITRPLVAYYNDQNESTEGNEDDGSGESSSEEGHSEDNSGEGDSNDDDEADDDPFLLDEVDTSLVIKLAKALVDFETSQSSLKGLPSLHHRALEIWPRKSSEMPLVPEGLKSWRCLDESLQTEMLAALEALAESNDRFDLALRLPEVVRSNAHSMETGSELRCYNDPARGLSNLSGLCLYDIRATTFNHDCKPTVARYSLADVIVFRTNQFVAAGQELAISYLAHDLLCEAKDERQAALERLHQKTFKIDHDPPTKDAYGPVIHAQVKFAFGELEPKERIEQIDATLNDPENAALLLQVDRKELFVMSAEAWSELGDAAKAAAAWEHCLEWAQAHLPPNDENEAVYAVHAGVCRLAAAGKGAKSAPGKDDEVKAAALLARAREVHEVAHGGGGAWMAIRFRNELLDAKFFPEAAARAWDFLSA